MQHVIAVSPRQRHARRRAGSGERRVQRRTPIQRRDAVLLWYAMARVLARVACSECDESYLCGKLLLNKPDSLPMIEHD